MKTSERHQLKEDDFVAAIDRTRGLFTENRRNISLVGTIVLLAILIVGGYVFWRQHRNDSASSLLADAMTTLDAPVVPPQPPGTLNPTPVPANSFPTERARSEAALPKLAAVSAAYPKTKAGIAATYRAAGLLMELGRLPEAEQRFAQVAALDGSGVYGRMAQLGLASIQVQSKKFDQTISTLQTLSQRTDGDLPVDGILMQLGHAYRDAGRTPDAVRTFTRIVDEFPQSAYAADARKQLDELKAAPPAAAAHS